MRKKRILFGAVDIGYRIEHYSNFINEYFHKELTAESFSKYILPKSHFSTSYTYSCEVSKMPRLFVYLYIFVFFIYALFRFDIFHFLSGELILTRKLRKMEFFIYKLLNKRVIMHFVGADIRSYKYLDWKRENIHLYLAGEVNPYNLSEPFQVELIKDSRKYADEILVSTPDLLDIIPEAKYIPVLLNPKDIPIVTSKNKESIVTLLFSPSSHRTKGSDYIHNVLHNIKAKYSDKIEIVMPGINLEKDKFYAMTRYDLLNQFKNTDIVIDQMIIGWYGLKSVEALYMGCKVICYIDEKYKKYLFNDCPIIDTEIENLYEKLIEIIDSYLSEKNKETNFNNWVKNNHTIEAYSTVFKTIWNI